MKLSIPLIEREPRPHASRIPEADCRGACEPSVILLQRLAGPSIAAWFLFAAGAALYSYHLGEGALGPSEAYSALAAAQPNISAVARNAMQFDPGKPLLYHIFLHWFCFAFGTSEAALRAFSLIFGVGSVILVFAYGAELFGSEVGFAAAAIWAFNPLALVFARWARMYSMFVALTLGHLLAMARLQRRPTKTITMIAGLLGAAMLYTHLAAVLVIGADLVVVVREFRRERHSASWPAVAIALILFLPFIPTASAQIHALLYGHWVDWIGVPHHSMGTRAVVSLLTLCVFLGLMLGMRRHSAKSELAVRCTLYAVVPMLGLVAGSIVMRPMFTVRYAAPSFAVGAVIVAMVLDQGGRRIRKDITLAVVALLIMLSPLSFKAQDQPWRAIAMRVAAAPGADETVFFETGFFSPERMIDQQENDGFPRGFFLVPFEYYFKGPNPNGAVPGDDPMRARQLIEKAALKAGGAWMISGKKRTDALAELPQAGPFQLDFEQDFSRVLLLHIRVMNRRPQFVTSALPNPRGL